jgi:hypothetical protein
MPVDLNGGVVQEGTICEPGQVCHITDEAAIGSAVISIQIVSKSG